MKDLIYDLYEEIKHGDEEHQRWLKDKIDDFINRKQSDTQSLNTWISVKDAMPEVDSPESEGYDLICIDDCDEIFHVQFYAPTKEFLTIEDKSVEDVRFWMLLSKPTTN